MFDKKIDLTQFGIVGKIDVRDIETAGYVHALNHSMSYFVIHLKGGAVLKSKAFMGSGAVRMEEEFFRAWQQIAGGG